MTGETDPIRPWQWLVLALVGFLIGAGVASLLHTLTEFMR